MAPAHTDPFVAQSVSRAVAEERDILTHRLEEGEPPGSGVLRVVLGLPAGMPGRRRSRPWRPGSASSLATDGELRARVDELTFAVEAVRR